MAGLPVVSTSSADRKSNSAQRSRTRCRSGMDDRQNYGRGMVTPAVNLSLYLSRHGSSISHFLLVDVFNYKENPELS